MVLPYSRTVLSFTPEPGLARAPLPNNFSLVLAPFLSSGVAETGAEEAPLVKRHVLQHERDASTGRPEQVGCRICDRRARLCQARGLQPAPGKAPSQPSVRAGQGSGRPRCEDSPCPRSGGLTVVCGWSGDREGELHESL